jgi:hypothetical protein
MIEHSVSKIYREEKLEERGISLKLKLEAPPRQPLRIRSDGFHVVFSYSIVLAPIPALAQFALKLAGLKFDAGEAVTIHLVRHLYGWGLVQ